MTERHGDAGTGLELLASAVAGQRIDVDPTALSSLTWTDGSTVFVSADAPPRDQMRAVIVQASLLAAGSLGSDILGALIRRPALIRRYLAVEGHRALASQEGLLPASVVTVIDRSTAAMTDSPATSLILAAGSRELPAPPSVFGTIAPDQVRPAPAGDTARSGAGHIPRSPREQMLRELDDCEVDEGTGFDDVSPIGGGGAIGRFLQKLMGSARSTHGGGHPGAESPTHRTRGGVAGSGAVTSSHRAVRLDDVDVSRPRAATYPEWNVHDRRYRSDWCTVTETRPETLNRQPVADLHSTALRRPLARLGVDLERRRRQLQGDDLDIDAVVQARCEIAAGAAPSEAFYVDSVRSRRDLSVLILLDVSGSAGDPSPAGATVHEHQRAAAMSLTCALHALGDRVALYGFRSQGRSAVQVLPLKRFGDGLDTVAVQRLAGIVPCAYTRIGAAIRHSAAVLEADGGTARRLLIVLSDGFAYDHGYEGHYGEADARRALAEARRAGTACLCLSIGASTATDALRRVFGTAAHAGLPTVGSLAAVIGPLFSSALRLAEQQRRTAQRTERTRERLRIEGSSG